LQESGLLGKFFCQLIAGRPMKFSLFGASKTGISIAYHLCKNGHQPIFTWNRSEENLAKALEYVPFESSSKNLKDFNEECDFVILSISDDAIEDIAERFLSINKNKDLKILHTSGALDSSVFGDYENSGSFHPVISISSIEEGIEMIPQTTFTCEGNISTFLVQIANEIGETGITLTKEQKQNIHLSAVFMNNYMIGLIEKIKILNRDAGLEDHSTEKILQAITRQTISKSWKNTIEETLTGPVKRGDEKTIKKHLDILKNDDLFQQLYKIFGNILINFVNQDIEKVEALKELFKIDVSER